MTLHQTASYYMILHMFQAPFQVTFLPLEYHAPAGTRETLVLALHLRHGVPKNLNRFHISKHEGASGLITNDHNDASNM